MRPKQTIGKRLLKKAKIVEEVDSLGTNPRPLRRMIDNDWMRRSTLIIKEKAIADTLKDILVDWLVNDRPKGNRFANGDGSWSDGF